MAEIRPSFEWELADLDLEDEISLPGISMDEDVDRFCVTPPEKGEISPSPVDTPRWYISSLGSPSTPYEELDFTSMDEVDTVPFLLEAASDVLQDDNHMLPFQKRLEATSRSLAASMMRSQETRKFLAAKTTKTENYVRRDSVKGVMESVQKSMAELQTLLPVASSVDIVSG